MKTFPLYLLFVISISTYSQTKDLHFSTENPGIRIADKKIIRGEYYEPGGRIENIFADSATHLLYVWLREIQPSGESLERKGEFLAIDLATKKELWRKEFDYLQEHIRSFPGHLLFTRRNRSKLIDIHTGKEIWEKKIVPHTTHYDPEYMLGLKGLNTLVRVNIPSGETVWQRNIKHKFGWNSDYAVNDSTHLVYADALHLIHLNNGTGASYKIKTGTYDYKGLMYGVALSILSMGTAIFVFINPVNTASNAIFQDSLIYLAGRKEIVCLDSKTLQLIWRNDLNGRNLTSSDLFILGDRLYLINKGYPRSTPYFDAPTQTGTSFLASFDKHNGKTISLHELPGQIIDNYRLGEDTLCLWNTQGMYSYSIFYDLPPKYFPWDTEKHGKIKKISHNSFYRSKLLESHAFPIPQKSDHRILYTEQGIMYEVDGRLNIFHEYYSTDLYSSSFRWNNYTFIQGYTNFQTTCDSYLLDKEGKKIGSFKVKDSVYCVQDTLYAIDGEAKKIFILNLSEYFNPSTTDPEISAEKTILIRSESSFEEKSK